eukprot:TRINITY_DN5367_c0_g1_i2.p1 TRINITY_DN5367_c0_g1~~TRINITY_DN5367_c0_g1_i2.p1  ORF type:complete len:223 (-),score=40.46 TRINITY_DN5367_c0_g1_i2:63-701(-)
MGACRSTSRKSAAPLDARTGDGGFQKPHTGAVSAAAAANCPLVAFLQGSGPDNQGRMLEEILEWDDVRMERVHNYVQWIFPTDEQSMFNGSAPLMTPEVQQICREDAAIRANFDRILERFLAFLGLQLEGEPGSLCIRRAPFFDRRVPDCWTSMGGFGNHNWLRLSRVIHCLGMVGMKEQQQALLACLEQLIKDGFDMRSALPHWRERAKVE